ncbi:hypothetical protein HDU79_009009 [Rhizoclosmatium sp. JEL0117]|nr:hypothetical protein HDU79_009009 [Rhizoclosmatium sp. JEL0117]
MLSIRLQKAIAFILSIFFLLSVLYMFLPTYLLKDFIYSLYPTPQPPRIVHAAYNGKQPTFAVAVKTTADRMDDYLPILFETSLSPIPKENIIVMGDGKGDKNVGEIKVLDVYDGLYERTKKRMLWRQDLLDEMVPEYLAGKEDAVVQPDGFDENHALRRRSVDLDGSAPVAADLNNRLRKRDGSEDYDKSKTKETGEKMKIESSLIDPHKNLAGLQLLGDRYLDKGVDWYFLIQDDTYIVLPNVIRFVEGLDPEKQYYIGKPTDWKGCDNVHEAGKGPVIAVGSAGVLVSRGGMRALMNVIDNCILKYRSCFGGDIRTGLCFRDAGILLTWDNSFFLSSPYDEEFQYPDEPCEEPKTFKTSFLDDMEDIHALSVASASQRNSTLSTGQIYRKVSASMNIQSKNVDRPGGEYRVLRIADAKTCERACLKDVGKCVGWVVDRTKKCLLKSTPGAAKKRKGYMSGVIVSRYQCRKPKTYALHLDKKPQHGGKMG